MSMHIAHGRPRYAHVRTDTEQYLIAQTRAVARSCLCWICIAEETWVLAVEVVRGRIVEAARPLSSSTVVLPSSKLNSSELARELPLRPPAPCRTYRLYASSGLRPAGIASVQRVDDTTQWSFIPPEPSQLGLSSHLSKLRPVGDRPCKQEASLRHTSCSHTHANCGLYHARYAPRLRNF